MLEKSTVLLALQRLGLSVAVLALVGSGIAAAATITVTNTADNGPKSLRQALAAAADGDTINISAKGTLTLLSGELIVNKSVNIHGPGAAKLNISGGGNNRVFHITPNAVVSITDLTVSNGNASTDFGDFLTSAGGGIFSDHANLTLTNCVIIGNSAFFGGGVFSDSQFGGSAVLTINNSTLRDNSATYGGGVFSGGGFVNTGPSGDATVQINSASINDNSASVGGGIFNDGFDGSSTLTLTNSLINVPAPSPDAVNAFGTAIYNNGDSGVAAATLTRCTVTGKPFEFGSEGTIGIYNDGSSSVSPGNASMAITDSAVTGDFGFGGGGIVSSGSAIVALTNSTVSLNAGPGLTNLLGNAAVNSSNISHNGIGISNQAGTLTLNSSIVSANSDVFLGGISNAAGGSATLNKSTVTDNAGRGISNDCAVLALNETSVSSSGGGVGIESICALGQQLSSTVTLRNSTVSENAGGGIFNYGGEGSAATFTLINSTVSSNMGIGIYTSGVDDGVGSLILENSTLSGNLLPPGSGASGIQNISLGGTANVEITNTIINADASGSIGSTGTVISHGYNLSSDSGGGFLNGPGDLINTDPMLGPLKNNGGLTKTHALLSGSPAIDAGDPNFDANAFSPPLIYDQRNVPGFPRVVNGRIDIGAFENNHP